MSNDTSKRMLIVAIATAVILLVPLVAMQFTSEVNWTGSDFAIAGILLLGAGSTYVFTTRNVENGRRRFFIGLAVFLVLAYIWAELAVGIFTNLGS